MKKIALVGCGRISEKHIYAILSNHKRAILVAICDPDQKRLENTINKIKEFSEKLFIKYHNPKKYEDIENLIEKESNQLDLIVLATPSGLHPKQVIFASKAKLNICTEKPMATNWEDGLAMVKACKKI